MWNLWAQIEPLLATISALILGGGLLSLIPIGIFKLLGEKWLNAKFDERLAAYKHAQQKELERLRFEINALFDRTAKLHQREFEIIPQAWALLVDARSAVDSLTYPLQEYPDLNRMSEPQLEEFLEKSPLHNWQKAELKQENDKLRYYQSAIFWHRLSDTRKIFGDHHNFLLKNGIFMPPEMKVKFTELSDIIWNALIEHQAHKDFKKNIPLELKARAAFDKQGSELMKSLEREVQQRLWSVPSDT
jgi:hypothetical protein